MTAINGVGLGLRAKHFDTILTQRPPVPWFEVVADQFPHSNGIIIDKLQQISQHYPVVLHCLGCSVGSTDPLNMHYLSAVKSLAQQINAAWISDHCCWVSTQGQYLFDLMPLPLTETTADHVASRAHLIQDYLERPYALENVSAYFAYHSNTMTEAQFLNQVATRANIGILLDVNNVYVSAHNQGYKPQAYLDDIDPKHVIQMHLAGYEQQENLLIDTHGQAVHAPVWQLYQQALARFGTVPTSIEWDSHIPDWPTYWAEQQQATHYLQAAPSVSARQQGQYINTPQPDTTTLANLQNDIAMMVWPTGPELTDDTISSNPPTLQHLAHSPEEALERLRIYRNSIMGNVVGAYRRIFPATRHLVGDEYLTHLIEDHLQQAHCSEPDITAGTANLITFVQTHKPTQQAVPYLADFMHYEWYWYRTFHHGDTEAPLTLHSTYPLAEIWTMCQPEYQGDPHWPDSGASEFNYEFIYQHGKVLVLLKET